MTSAIGKIRNSPIVNSITIDNSWLIDIVYVCQFYVVKKNWEKGYPLFGDGLFHKIYPDECN